ncbi:DNA topoisomerase (ATP-hydrolyzing) subunit A [Leadbettera azotonutricia]|uniref:DNA gyrase subunit A n=1 Tax=Leadbettera azotonutricia (strain ATCC BAA-888 / DSM 13862 / ZAS-9) TaxID=545695 RepID=F5YGG7_LEAAZ|nr:DNA topoisomerase (ATP-hydrolyzing) subunit A [Leadbettera azotonutricia]AEF83346.1 DNA gyrase, A subunit [Leadbettera azotonutricia ZAS-9]
MAETSDIPVPTGKIIPVAIEDEVKTDYLNYAMSVIVSRALPDVRDGLKPVHRRLLFSMGELGLHPNATTKKCARIVGDTMGKYHPHGDLSLYDALVRMAQDFSLRYPLVQGQGNFGSLDDDPPAAMRYTEAKLSKIGDEMLQDLNKETVDFTPNFSEEELEPTVLPAAVPNLLINGSSGIAVGMATNMAPHNLVEVCEAVCAFIDNPDVTIEDLMKFIDGPDFPTGGIIFGRRGIREAYKTGRGKILVRGRFIIETTKSGKEQIVFNEIPYGVNKKLLIERIGVMVRDKEIDGVSYVNDESSDREGIRVVIELKKGAIIKVVLNRLFANTQLQATFGIINLALVNGRPRTLNLKELVSYFVDHRVEVVTRRTQYDLRKAEERAHILEGLVIALANIDEVVAIIKASRDVAAAKAKLQERFLLSEPQTKAIVEMQLGRLTSLEVEKLQAELAELQIQIAYYKDLLADPVKLRNVIKDETKSISSRYGDKRRTEIVNGEVENINIEDLIKKEEMMITISNLGYVKRVPVSAYKNQGRGGKGMQAAKLTEDDFVEQIFVASTHEYIMFITNEGKAYWMKVHELPEGTRTSKGAHIKSLLTVSPNEDITAIVSFKDFSDDQYILMGTARGVVKKVKTSEFSNAKTRGIIAIKLDEGDELVSALLTGGKDEVVLISRRGQALRTHEDAVRPMGRAGHGVTGMKLASGDELTGLLKVSEDEKMLILSEYGFGKRVDFSEFSSHGRGTGGQKIYTVGEKTGEIVGCVGVRDKEEIMCITSQGKSIKLKVASIRVMGRSAQGVKILSIDKPDFVSGLDRIVQEEEAPHAQDEGQLEFPLEENDSSAVSSEPEE